MAKFDRVTFHGTDKDGNERFFAGIPARDLTGEEFYRHDEATRDNLLKSGLYVGVHDAPPARRPAATETTNRPGTTGEKEG